MYGPFGEWILPNTRSALDSASILPPADMSPFDLTVYRTLEPFGTVRRSISKPNAHISHQFHWPRRTTTVVFQLLKSGSCCVILTLIVNALGLLIDRTGTKIIMTRRVPVQRAVERDEIPYP